MASKELSVRRYRWLKRKKLTLKTFAEKVGEEFGTAYSWFEFGRTPRRRYLNNVLSVFKDWPVAK
jgi:hypothetical protein